MSDRDQEFYVGYLDQAPAGIAARTRSQVIACLVLVSILGLGLAAAFAPLPRATFEFGRLRSFEGTLRLDPYPSLWVARPGSESEASRYHLVAPFKFGADEEVRELEGQHVRLEGTLVHRDGQTMVEVVPASLKPTGEAPLSPRASSSRGEVRLVGEIVDSKCFLGVMNPGNLKPHRACAVRCISGGIPPVLCVRDEQGLAEYFLLVGEDGGAMNDVVLEHVAMPVEVRGTAELLGEQWILRTSAQGIRGL